MSFPCGKREEGKSERNPSIIFNRQTNFAGEVAHRLLTGWIQQQGSPYLISSAFATGFHSSWSHVPEEGQMIQLLDKQEINTIILSKKYHHELLLLCSLPFLPLCKAILKTRPWLVVWRGMFDTVTLRIRARFGAAFSQGTAGKEATEPPLLC